MTQEKWTAVDRYFDDMFVPPDPALENAMAASTAAGLPAFAVSPSQGKLLFLLAQMQARGASWKLGRWAATARFGWHELCHPAAA